MTALALAQSPAVLQSQKDGFPLLGQLYFEDGAETAIVEIELRDANDSTVLDRTTSNPAGQFHFNNVKVGRYWVVIEGARYQWIKHRLQIDVLTFGVINFELSLLPRRVAEHGEEVVPDGDSVTVFRTQNTSLWNTQQLEATQTRFCEAKASPAR